MLALGNTYLLARDRTICYMRARYGQDQPTFAVNVEQAESSDSTELCRMVFEQLRRPIFKWGHYVPAYGTELGPSRGLGVLDLAVIYGMLILACSSSGSGRPGCRETWRVAAALLVAP